LTPFEAIEAMRVELEWALDVIEREGPLFRTCGGCGTPNANCDSDCADAVYAAEHLRKIRQLVKEYEPC
jgi:hypothetical protein